MIDIKGIDFNYGRGMRPVLEDFSLSLEEGHIYGLLGMNGTGKSTLLYIICGLLRQQRGSVTIDGADIRERRPETLGDMFLVPEEFDLPRMKLKKYIKLNAPFYPKFSTETLEKCLSDFGMDTDINIGELSMGQKKKAFISFALAANTRYLFMDEPTNGLDIPAKSQFRKIVSRHATDDRTVIISTHQVRDIDMLLDHIIIMEGTKILLDKSVAGICSALRFEERAMGASIQDAIFAQASIAGHSVIVKNNDHGDETPLNLELLFNAVHANPGLLDR